MFVSPMRAPQRPPSVASSAPKFPPYIEERRVKLKEVIRHGEIIRELKRSGVGGRLKYEAMLHTGVLKPLPKLKPSEANRYSRDVFLQILTVLMNHAVQ